MSKVTKFLDDLKPKLQGFIASPKLFVHAGLAVNVLLGLILLSSLVGLYSFYSERAEHALESGKRVTISIPDGEVAGSAAKEVEAKEVAESSAEEGDEAPVDAEGGEAVAEAGSEGELDKEKEDVKQFVGIQSIDDKRPRIVIIISGLGLSKATTEEVFNLPSQVTLSFSPYASTVEEWVRRANELGYQTMLDMPMEPSDYPLSDPGPYALLTQATKEQNLAQLGAVANLATGHVGLLAEIDEQFTYMEESIIPILQEIRRKNLIFLYTNKPRNYFLSTAKEIEGMSLLANEIVLDKNLSADAIDAKLQEVETRAKQYGYVTAVGRPYPITVKRLQVWFKDLPNKGLVLAPVSYLFNK